MTGADDRTGSGPDAEVALRIAITAGGTPTDDEVAALVLALGATLAPAGPADAPAAPAAWRHAALVENAGRPRVERPSDLRGLGG